MPRRHSGRRRDYGRESGGDGERREREPETRRTPGVEDCRIEDGRLGVRCMRPYRQTGGKARSAGQRACYSRTSEPGFGLGCTALSGLCFPPG